MLTHICGPTMQWQASISLCFYTWKVTHYSQKSEPSYCFLVRVNFTRSGMKIRLKFTLSEVNFTLLILGVFFCLATLGFQLKFSLFSFFLKGGGQTLTIPWRLYTTGHSGFFGPAHSRFLYLRFNRKWSKTTQLTILPLSWLIYTLCQVVSIGRPYPDPRSKIRDSVDFNIFSFLHECALNGFYKRIFPLKAFLSCEMTLWKLDSVRS